MTVWAEAITEFRDAYRAHQEQNPGVVTAWTVIWTESMFGDDGEDLSSLVYQHPNHVPPWQVVGLLEVAKGQCVEWITG